VRSSQNWDLSVIGGISSDKIQRNVRESTLMLDNDVRQISAIIRRYSPLEMLKLACWEGHRILETGSDDEIREADALVRFLQRAYCLSSLCPDGPSSERNIPPKEFKRVVELFDDVFRKSCRFIDNSCLAARNATDGVKGSVLTAYQDMVMEDCFPSPLSLDTIQSKVRTLHFSLQPFNDAISKTFDCGLDGLVEAFSILFANGKTGLDTLRSDSSAYKNDMQEKLKELRALTGTYGDEKTLIDQVVKREHWENRIQSMVGRRDGYDLYDVSLYTSLGKEDLDLLSIPLCGEESDDSLYPVDDRVNQNRPFISISGHYFCFDTGHLLDDLPAIVKEQVLAKGVLSAAEWEKQEQQSSVLQPVSMIHSMFGSMGFTLSQTGFDAVFDFPSKQVGVKVLPRPSSDPLAEGHIVLKTIAKSRQDIAWVKSQMMQAIIIDASHEDDYPLDLVDGVLFLTYPQLVGLSQDPESLGKCKELLGLTEKRPEEDEEQDTAESMIKDETEDKEDVPVEEKEEDDQDEPDLSILNGEVVEESSDEPASEKDELDDDDTNEMINDSDDDELPPQEKHEETSKPYSFFTLLSEIANGRKEEPAPLEPTTVDWPAKSAEPEQPDMFFGQGEVMQAASEHADTLQKSEGKIDIPPMAETAAPTEETEPASPEEPDVKIDIPPMAEETAAPTEETEPASPEEPDVKIDIPPMAEETAAPTGQTEPTSPEEPDGKIDIPPMAEETAAPTGQAESTSPEEPDVKIEIPPMAETAAPTEQTEPASPEEPDVKIDIPPMAETAAPTGQAEPTSPEEPDVKIDIPPMAETAAPTEQAEPASPEEPDGKIDIPPMAETAAPTEETEPASPEEPDVKIDISPMAGAAAVREPASVPFEKPEVKGMVPPLEKPIPVSMPVLEDVVTSVVGGALDGKDVPAHLREILEFTQKVDGPFFTMCKQGDEQLLSASDGLIMKAQDAQHIDGKDKMFTLGQFGLTVILSAGRDDQMSRFDRRANIGAIMYAEGKDSWGCLTLDYDKNGKLRRANEEIINRKSYSASDWKYVTNIGERLLARRKKNG